MLVRFPGKPTRTPRTALLRMHPKSGILMIESLQKHCEVQYMLDNEPMILEVGRIHCFWQTTNLFAVGGLKFVLTYPRLGQRELEEIRKERDEVWNLRGLPAPDSRFPIVPPHNPLKRLDDGTIVLSNIAGGAFRIVGIGLNIKTGEPCAVKSVPIRGACVQKECMNEGDMFFKYPVSILIFSCSSLLILGFRAKLECSRLHILFAITEPPFTSEMQEISGQHSAIAKAPMSSISFCHWRLVILILSTSMK